MSKLSQWIKNKARKDSGFHELSNTFHDIQNQTQSDINKLSSTLAAIHDTQNQMQSDICKLVQDKIFMESDYPVDVILHLRDGAQKDLNLKLLRDGRLCFKQPSNEKDYRPPVFITTQPKAGTYLIGEILKNLGFDDIEIHAGDSGFSDYRNKSLEEKIYLHDSFGVFFPYNLQVQLVLPGQYLLGHLSAQAIEESHKARKVMLMIRDVRNAVLSHARFIYKRRKIITDDKLTPRDLINHLNTDADYFFQCVKECCILKNKTFVVPIRYEHLFFNDYESLIPVLDSIREVTYCDNAAIYEAIRKSIGATTLTYSGNPSILDKSKRSAKPYRVRSRRAAVGDFALAERGCYGLTEG